MNEQQQQHPLLEILQGSKLMPPMGPPSQSLEDITRNQTWAAQAADRQRAQERHIAAAREQAARLQREQEQANRAHEREAAERLERQTYTEEKSAYLAAGGMAEQFDAGWPRRYREICQGRADEMQRRARARVQAHF